MNLRNELTRYDHLTLNKMNQPPSIFFHLVFVVIIILNLLDQSVDNQNPLSINNFDYLIENTQELLLLLLLMRPLNLQVM